MSRAQVEEWPLQTNHVEAGREKNPNKYENRVVWFGLVGIVRNRWFVHGKHSDVPVETETIGNLRSFFLRQYMWPPMFENVTYCKG